MALLFIIANLVLVCVQAEDFHKKAHGLLEWLTDAERHLRYQGSMPEDEEVLIQQLAEHQVRVVSGQDHI